MSVNISQNENIQAPNYSGFGQQRIVQTPGGDLFACQISSSSAIEVYRSTDGGITWNINTTISSLTAPFQLSLCISPAGDVFLCFTNNSEYINVYRRNSSTAAWSNVLTYQQAGMTNGHPVPALITYNRYINRLHLVWAMNHPAVDNSYYNFNHKYSDDYGASWVDGTGNNVAGGTTYTTAPGLLGLTTSPVDGKIYLSGSPYPRFNEIYSWDANGGSWFRENTSYDYQYGAGICVAADNEWYSLRYYHRSSSYNMSIQVRNSTSNILNYSLGAPETLHLGELAIGCDNDSNVYIFYTLTVDGACYYRKYTKLTGTWSDEAVFSKDALGNTIVGRRPSCVLNPISGSDKLHVLFTTT